MVAEESETPGGEQGRGGPSEGTGFGGLGRRSEGDLLAERRARRAAESGKDALIERAEMAEATMQTLQAHVASLQEQLGEAERERRRLAELLAARRASEPPEQWPAHDPRGVGERELRHAMQREHAEQQLRADAEDRLRDVEAASRDELERVRRLLADSERHAHGLAQELDGVRRQLAEAEQAAAAERAALRLAERDLKGRLTALEQRTVELNRGLEVERGARERSERMLESMAHGHRLMQGVVGELRELVARLAAAVAGEAGRARGRTSPTQASSLPPRASSPPPRAGRRLSPRGGSPLRRPLRCQTSLACRSRRCASARQLARRRMAARRRARRPSRRAARWPTRSPTR